MKMIKRDEDNRQEINIETYLKNKKIKKENMEKIDISTCLKKRKKDKKIISKKLSWGKKLLINNK